MAERDGHLGEREFYAHAFAVWMFSSLGASFDAPRRQLLAAIEANGDRVSQHHPTKFHWEFVRFALEKAKRLGGLEPYTSVRAILGRERFANVRVANWSLLRAGARALGSRGLGAMVAGVERAIVLRYFQKSGGFIEDRRAAPTAQYHAFSAALLGMQIADSASARSRHLGAFLDAVCSLERIMLPSGDMNVFGRGAKQSFGYAGAVLAFAHAYAFTGEVRFLSALNKVAGFLSRAQREDGSLPLVLAGHETCRGEIVDLDDPAFAGWYIYNNYFDYLCFTGALLEEARTVLQQEPRSFAAAPEPQPAGEVIDNILRITRPAYSALVLPPGTVTADSLPLPFVEIGGLQPLPCYGGENYNNRLYRAEGMPLPVLVSPDGTTRTLFEPRAYRWNADLSFTGSGKDWSVKRMFEFGDDHFEVRDVVTVDGLGSGWTLRAPRLLMLADEVRLSADGAFEAPGLRIVCDVPLEPEVQDQWCARGRLIAYSATFPIPGEGLSVTSTLRFEITAAC